MRRLKYILFIFSAILFLHTSCKKDSEDVNPDTEIDEGDDTDGSDGGSGSGSDGGSGSGGDGGSGSGGDGGSGSGGDGGSGSGGDGGSGSGGDGGSGSGGIGSIAENELSAQKMLDLINEKRASGCECGKGGNTEFMPAVPLLKWNDKLEEAAYKHSKDMLDQDYFEHTGLDGSSPGDRITETGYRFFTWGENIAQGQRNEKQVMDAWTKSLGHCKNFMSDNFTEVGAGRAGNYWTQAFAAPR